MRLLLGLPFGGQRHFEFKVKLLTLGGECAALEKVDALKLGEKERLTRAEQTLVDLAYFSEQVEIDGIAPAQLTPAYLLEHLATDDYVLINDAILALRKKHIAAGESQSPTPGV